MYNIISLDEGKDMNKLSIDRQAQIIKMLCEGNSLRSTSRIAEVSINTVVKLLKDVGSACLTYQDTHIRNLKSNKLQVDEI
jgi:transposase-like protein